MALVGRTRGNCGEVFALPLSDHLERFQALREVWLFGAGERREVESAWFHSGSLILKFRGVDTIADAELLRGAEVRIPLAERIPLEAGEYFQSDLIGCQVVDRSTGEPLGAVVNWQDAGGAGLLELANGTLIPFVHAICVHIDVPARRIEVDLPPGLKELNRP